MEELPFLSEPKSRITKQLERTILELRPEMSITALANYFHLDWRCVKNVEKKALERKYASVPLKNVKVIGVDEIHVGKSGYKTIVRDLESGAVLSVSDGKGSESLESFSSKIKRSQASIEAVAMDMSTAYIKWATENLPEAKIVFDHFHVIKLMNDKLNQVRKQTVKQLKAEEADENLIKKKRFLLLKNEEDLDDDERKDIEEIRESYIDLGAASVLKEKLRLVYKLANDETEARTMLESWCAEAEATKVSQLKTMSKTIKKRIEGILAYWTTDRVTSAAVEGFNNKIRWLIKQAYGYHDQEYFRLKIFDLPKTKTNKEL
jgi:transposase